MIDYAMGILLIAAPWLLQFNRGGAETWIPVMLGAGMILYSLMTDYELGAFRSISMSAHLMLDGAAGVLLAASPWIFQFDDFVYLPHLLFGLLEVGAALMTRTSPSRAGMHSTGSVVR
jgi:hypothetical protein